MATSQDSGCNGKTDVLIIRQGPGFDIANEKVATCIHLIPCMYLELWDESFLSDRQDSKNVEWDALPWRPRHAE